MRRRFLTFAAAVACCASALAATPRVTDTTIDRIFAAYASGDVGIVAKTFANPADFQPLRLSTPDVLDEWLGDWQPQKATFVIELARAANRVAPAKTWPIVSAGRKYVTARPATAADDAFESIWHRTALGLLQGHSLATFEEHYLDALELRLKSPAAAHLARERLALSRAIAQEQRCWNDRPALDRAGDAVDGLARAAGLPVTSTAGVAKPDLVAERARHHACLSEAIGRFDTAAAGEGDAAVEARVRGAWMRFQLGQFQEALRTIEKTASVEDRDLTYWAALFTGRINDALGHHAEAERAYRAALAACPDAQSAGIGLALALFRMDRAADADAAALAVRAHSGAAPDPWWTYFTADERFVERWTDMLRAAHR